VSAEKDGGSRGRLLLVDDEPTLLGGYQRALSEAGYTIALAGDGKEALGLLERESFDVIVSDIRMPNMDGIQLLRAAREHDLDVPVVLITGTPSVASAIRAVEYGALRYLVKPIALAADIKRQALALGGASDTQSGDRAGLEVTFERGLRSLWIAYQPIVSWSRRSVYSKEALLRTAEPALPSPGALLDAAERLSRMNDLGRAVRSRVANTAGRGHGGDLVFVNLHPQDLSDPELYSTEAPLSRIAGRVVLEITERASLEQVADPLLRVARLREMGYRIAIDDLGAGYAGLSSFAQLQPEVVKIDMSLVRGVDADRTRQRLVRSLIELCREMEMLVVAEGVETIPERDMLVALGCDLLQGYLFCRPGETLLHSGAWA
jgi:EAL domain-containing protein (putative c-di-GMP-specific phosphodiesterase class I)